MEWARKNIGYILLSLAAGALLFVAGLAIYNGLESQQADKVQTAKATQDAHDRARVQVQRDCGPLPPPRQEQCEQQVQDSYESNRREIDDLQAQRITASWTFLMGIAAIAGTTFGIIGVSLVLLTFMEQRRTSRAELRAYVSVKMGTLITGPNGSKAEANFLMRNGGTTPAYNVVHLGDIRIWDVPLPADPGIMFESASRRGLPTPGVIHAGDDYFGSLESSEPLDIEENIQAIAKGDKAIYVIGEVYYRDTFNQNHVTEFCYCLCGEAFKRSRLASAARPGQPVEIQWGVANFHNDAT